MVDTDRISNMQSIHFCLFQYRFLPSVSKFAHKRKTNGLPTSRTSFILWPFDVTLARLLLWPMNVKECRPRSLAETFSPN